MKDCVAKGCLLTYDKLISASESQGGFIGEQLAFFASQLEVTEGFFGCIDQVLDTGFWRPTEFPAPDQNSKLKDVTCGDNPNFFVGNAAPATAMNGVVAGGTTTFVSGGQNSKAKVLGSTFAFKKGNCSGPVCPFVLTELDLVGEDVKLGLYTLVQPVVSLKSPAMGAIEGEHVMFGDEAVRMRVEFGVKIAGIPVFGNARFTASGVNVGQATGKLAGDLFSVESLTYVYGTSKATLKMLPSPCEPDEL